MAYTKSTAPNIDAQIDAAFRQAETGLAEGKTVVLFVNTLEIERYVLRYAADRALQTLGITVTTVSRWAEDRWGLVGDGRRIVSSIERTYYMKLALSASRGSLPKGAGSVALLEKLAVSYLTEFTSLQTSRMQEANLTKAETLLCLALNSYRALLKRNGLVELSEVLEELPEFENVFFVYLEAFETPYHHDQLLRKQGRATSVRHIACICAVGAQDEARVLELSALLKSLPYRNKEKQDIVQPDGALRVLLPSGTYAAPYLVAQTICQLLEKQEEPGGSVALVCVDTLYWYKQLSSKLLDEGVTLEASLSMSLSQSYLTRLCTLLIDLVCNAEDKSYINPQQLSDIAYALQSNLSAERIHAFDSAVRAKRVIDTEGALKLIAGLSDLTATLVDCLRVGNYEQMAQYCFTAMESSVISDFDAAYLRASYRALSNIFEIWNPQEMTWTDVKGIIELKSVTFNVGCKGNVVLFPFMQANNLAPVTYKAVVVCDGTSKQLSSCTTKDATNLILQKLGIVSESLRLDQQRYALFFAVQAATDNVFLERPLCDEKGEAYTSATIFDELFDCYVNDPTDSSQYTKSGIPLVLGYEEYGEEALTRNYLHAEQTDECSLDYYHTFALDDDLKQYVAPTKDVEGNKRLSLSASAIESYLMCPYKWFLERRLRLETPDAEFGALERGSFVHEIMREFYLLLGNATQAKRVTSANIPECLQLFDSVFDRKQSEQYLLPPQDSPYIPREPLEAQLVETLRNQLKSFIERQVNLLPGYTPIAFEVSFGKDVPVVYAGVYLQGSIDRIDCDNQGNLVIIDYKGSLSNNYNPVSAEPDQLPEHVQALIYAKVAQELFPDNHVVGALYLSYGRKEDIRGVVDGVNLLKKDVGILSQHKSGVLAANSCGASSFNELLEITEARIESQLACLEVGDIQPCPKSKDACTYCLMAQCPVRDGNEPQ